MPNPRSLVLALYNHWDVVELLVRMSREHPALGSEQVLGGIRKVSPQLDAEAGGAVLRALVNADILQALPRSNDLQLNAYVLGFVRGLTREHELGLAAVLRARVSAIREASEALNAGMAAGDLDRARGAAARLAELFRQISLQLDQDRHALLELAETAKSADSSMPIAQRYRQVLEAYDQYVEPMNQMMDTGPTAPSIDTWRMPSARSIWRSTSCRCRARSIRTAGSCARSPTRQRSCAASGAWSRCSARTSCCHCARNCASTTP